MKLNWKKVGIFVGGIAVASGLLAWGAITAINVLEGTAPQEDVQDYTAQEVAKVIERAEAEDEFNIRVVTDDNVQNAIHGMSHQKVKAGAKWGGTPVLLTTENVQALYDAVNMNVDALKHDDVYLEILSRWVAGDFTQADKDHNAIWRLQNGNVGKATGVFSPAEERAYIMEQYKQ